MFFHYLVYFYTKCFWSNVVRLWKLLKMTTKKTMWKLKFYCFNCNVAFLLLFKCVTWNLKKKKKVSRCPYFSAVLHGVLSLCWQYRGGAVGWGTALLVLFEGSPWLTLLVVSILPYLCSSGSTAIKTLIVPES